MKTIIGILLLLIFTYGGQAQGFWEWSDPEPLTDSLTDNRNAFLFNAYAGGEYTLCMLWEKAYDSLSTEIWWNFWGDGIPPERIMTSIPDVHFTHPKAVTYPYSPNGDSTFYIFYETDQVGNNDIYYMIYRSDGSLTLPEPLANSAQDESQLTVFRRYFSDAYPIEMGPMVWIRGHALWGCSLIDDGGQYFTEEVLIDSAVCANPSYGEPMFTGDGAGVLYERTDTSGTYLYKVNYLGDGEWGSPELYYDSLESRNPTRTAHYGDACWSVLDDTVWKVAKEDHYFWGDTLIIDSLYKQTPFDPAVLGQVVGVEDWSGFYWIAVTYPADSIDEIFMTDMGPYEGFENFTSSGTMNRNPKFFNGEDHWLTGCWFDYLVWESYRNGHWQIWASKTVQCAGSTDENEDSENLVKTYPNPFTYETTLLFTLDARSDVRIEAYDMKGRLVEVITEQSYDQGKHQLRWNAAGLPEGVYVIRMTIENEVYTSRIIKAD